MCSCNTMDSASTKADVSDSSIIEGGNANGNLLEKIEKTEKQKANEAKRLAKLEKFKAKQDKLDQEKAEQALKERNNQAKANPKKSTIDQVAIPVTPPGQKKDISGEMAPSYSPKAVEEGWYSWWESSGFFKPEIVLEKDPKAESYTIAIPPPNITGSLHLGHAMGLSIQDSLIRWQRMKGKAALFLPGCDHAGISCQVVVEKQIWKNEKKTRHDLGRKEFLDRVWQWKNQYGSRIYDQFRKIGASLDWGRVTFTLDEKYNQAVTNSFIQFFEDGIVYRDNRLVNWSGKLQTTVSDLEVDAMELTGKTMLKVHGHDDKKLYPFGQMYDVAYRVINADGILTTDEIVVATTRPETIPGDVAVAVHPDDARYKPFHGLKLSHPLTGRAVPLILDSMADMSFGTGAVKITPAHDPNDFQAGLRHKLPMPNIFTDENRLNENAHIPELVGLMRFDAREKIVAMLEFNGLLRGVKDHAMTLPICNRSGDIIEPKLRPQWWLKCADLAKQSADLVRNADMTLLPKEAEKTWFHWLDNCKDWCLSRQLWWGHQIPAYLVSHQGVNYGWQAAHSADDAFCRLQKKGIIPENVTIEECQIEKDPDVFDTWYSAALWPLVTLNWTGQYLNNSRYPPPAEFMSDFDQFFPTSLLETGRDIIFFWVARMVMFSLYFTGKTPFTSVFLHSIVRDAHGRKMSKSLGNVIDPLDVIHGISLQALHDQLLNGNLDPKEVQTAIQGQKKDFPNGITECGTDALRFALCAYTSPGADINLDIARVEGYRKFCNKIWNAAKFVISKLKERDSSQQIDYMSPHPAGEMDLFTKWILGRMSAMAKDLDIYLQDYNFLKATSVLHSFFLYDFCDIYIEVSKKSTSPTVYWTLFHCLLTWLKCCHPFMPYITEELYQRVFVATNIDLPCRSISLDKFPQESFSIPPIIEQQVSLIMDLVKNIRIQSKDMKGPFQATLVIEDANTLQLVSSQKLAILPLIKYLKDLIIKDGKEQSLPEMISLETANIMAKIEQLSL